VHSFSTRQYQLNSIKTCPSEIAELAAMSMELFAMEHWAVIFENPERIDFGFQSGEGLKTNECWSSNALPRPRTKRAATENGR